MLRELRTSLENEQIAYLQLAEFNQQHAADVLDVLLSVHQIGKRLPEKITHVMIIEPIDDPRIADIPERHRAAGFDACIDWIYKACYVPFSCCSFFC